MGLIPSRDPWRRRTLALGVDLHCVHCQYNLRGLALSGRCPECGGLIWDSFLRKDLPALYRAVRQGAILCACLAAAPWLVLVLLVIEHRAGATEAASVPLLLLAIGTLGGGTVGWRFVAVADFWPDDRRQVHIGLLSVLASGCLVAMVVLQMAGVPRVALWMGDGAVVLGLALVGVTLALPARMLYALDGTSLSRAIQVVQIGALFPAVACLGCLLLEMTGVAGLERGLAYGLAALYAAGLSAAMLMTALWLRRCTFR